MIFNFKDRNRCKHKMELRNHMGFIISEERCVLKAEHPGPHVDRNNQQWVTRMDKQRMLEERG